MQGRFSLSPSLFNYSLVFIHILGHKLILSLFCCSNYSSCGLWGRLQAGPFVLWTCSPHPPHPLFFFYTTLSYSGATNMLRVYLVFSPLQDLEFIISLGSLFPFIGEWRLEPKVLCQVCSLLLGCPGFQALSMDRSRKWMHNNPRIHTYLYFCVFLSKYRKINTNSH